MSEEQNLQAEDDFDAAFNEFASTETEAPDPAVEPEPEQAPELSVDDVRQQYEALRQQAEQIKAERDAWQHRYNSDAGRVSAFQRQINALQAQLAEKERPPVDPDDPWTKLREEYPEIAEALDARMKAELEARVAPLAAPVQHLAAAEAQRATERAIAALASEHPDYQQIARSPDLARWIGEQPPAVQEMARSTQDPRELSWVFRQFKQQSQPAPAQSGASLQARRTERLQAAAGVPASSAAAGSRPLPKDDFDAAFEYYARRSTSKR